MTLITVTDTAVKALSISIDCVRLLLFKCELRCERSVVRLFLCCIGKTLPAWLYDEFKGNNNHYLRTFFSNTLFVVILSHLFISFLCLVSTLLKKVTSLTFSRCWVHLLSLIFRLLL